DRHQLGVRQGALPHPGEFLAGLERLREIADPVPVPDLADFGRGNRAIHRTVAPPRIRFRLAAASSGFAPASVSVFTREPVRVPVAFFDLHPPTIAARGPPGARGAGPPGALAALQPAMRTFLPSMVSRPSKKRRTASG